ncbi:MAG: nickel pincer cofactor-dependent isomerase, group 22 [Anaerolineae bacterium]
MSSVIHPRRSLDGLVLYRIRQRWHQPQVADIEQEVITQVARGGLLAKLKPGDQVAITAGSRGIADIATVLRALLRAVRAGGGVPFIFPAMGSHGGGTAVGQESMLAELGITERTTGAPIRATMDVVQIGHTSSGTPVYLDAFAAKADGIIVVNRIKKHTNIDGQVESGLCKMMAIGMGKHTGAAVMHQLSNTNLANEIIPGAQIVLQQSPIWGGVALIENATGGLAEIVGLGHDDIITREPELLQRARTLSAKIPFHTIDIALVERMGKETSGTGMDCYVIGRRRIIGEPEWQEAPTIHSLVLLDISQASHGNAVGVGLADFTTQRLVNKIDWQVTMANVLTSGNLERAKIPLTFPDDRQALEAAAFRERSQSLAALRFVALRDTLHLHELVISEALYRDCRSDVEVLDGPFPVRYDVHGNWISPLIS